MSKREMCWKVCFISHEDFIKGGERLALRSIKAGDTSSLFKFLHSIGYKVPEDAKVLDFLSSMVYARMDIILEHPDWKDLFPDLPKLPNNPEEIDILKLPFDYIPEVEKEA